MNIQAYLYFNGRCAEAVEFYRRALGAQVETMMRVGDSPEPPPPGALPPAAENNVMHAALKIGDSYLLASDGMAAGPAQFAGFNLSLHARPIGYLQRSPTAVRCRCRWARRSGHRSSVS
jgi:PhnB protein